MSKIFSFGCSFSSGYLEVPRDSAYPKIVSEELGFGCENFSMPGNCNDKIFFDLLKNEHLIESGDIILYQFSSFNRTGFFKKDGGYISSAGIPELGPSHKIKEEIFRGFKIEDLEILLDYIEVWNPLRKKFLLENSLNFLSVLERERSVRSVILFLTNDVQISGNNIINLSYEGRSNNLSLNDYLDHSGLTIGHEYPEKYPDGDTHPGFSGHKKIATKILQKLKDGNNSKEARRVLY